MQEGKSHKFGKGEVLLLLNQVRCILASITVDIVIAYISLA